MDIRDVSGGEEPFVYSSGNRGPGYVMIKGLVGQPPVLNYLTTQLALKLAEAKKEIEKERSQTKAIDTMLGEEMKKVAEARKECERLVAFIGQTDPITVYEIELKKVRQLESTVTTLRQALEKILSIIPTMPGESVNIFSVMYIAKEALSDAEGKTL